MGIPTTGEEFTKYIEFNRKAQEAAAMLSHLCRSEDKVRAQGWLAISEFHKRLVIQSTKLAMARM